MTTSSAANLAGSGALTSPASGPAGDAKTLLIVDDDAPFRLRLTQAMEKRGFIVSAFDSVPGAIEYVKRAAPAYAVVDLRLGDGNGLDVVAAIHELRPTTRVVMLTGYGNIATAVAAVRTAEGFVLLPVHRGATVAAVTRAGVNHHAVDEARHASLGLRGRSNYVDGLAATLDSKLHRAGSGREEGVVATATDVDAGMEVGAALPDNDLARLDDLAAEPLDAESLRVGFATVA